MYFGLSEEQQFFQESIDKFLEDTVTVDALRSYRMGGDNNLVDEVYNGLNELGQVRLNHYIPHLPSYCLHPFYMI